MTSPPNRPSSTDFAGAGHENESAWPIHSPKTSRDLEDLYGVLSELRFRLGGFRQLRDTSGRSGWPRRGVYFFFDKHEPRGSGNELRVVRVGTHALRPGSRTTLWGRLHNHKGHEGGRHPDVEPEYLEPRC